VDDGMAQANSGRPVADELRWDSHGPVGRGAGHDESLLAMRSTTVLRGGLAVGLSSYDTVMAEHAPQLPRGESCRACGFVYAGQSACPAVILAEAGHADVADRVKIVPQADPEYGALCELTVAVERLGARVDVIGASISAVSPVTKARRRRLWPRLVVSRRLG